MVSIKTCCLIEHLLHLCHSLCFISGVTRGYVEVQCVSYILLQHERSKVGRHFLGRVRRLGPAH